MKKYRYWIAIMLLLSVATLSFTSEKMKYEGTGFLSKLKIPLKLSRWEGEDVSAKLNVTPDRDIFNFISEILAYQYVNKQGEKLLFIVLDAGNFHHPKVCFTSAGYNIRELDDTVFDVMGRTVKTHTLFTERGKESFLSFYWISIDKNIAHEWMEQKLKQLYFSVFNKKRVGLMIRIDIPTAGDNIQNSMGIAKNFIVDMSKTLQQDDADYILGKY